MNKHHHGAPVAVPKSRFPQKGLKKGRKVLMANLNGKFVLAHPRESTANLSDWGPTGVFPVSTNQDPGLFSDPSPSRTLFESESLSTNENLALFESENLSTNENLRGGNNSEGFDQPLPDTPVL